MDARLESLTTKELQALRAEIDAILAARADVLPTNTSDKSGDCPPRDRPGLVGNDGHGGAIGGQTADVPPGAWLEEYESGGHRYKRWRWRDAQGRKKLRYIGKV